MNSGNFPVNDRRYVQELSYTCFPVKLFRIVTSEKYLSLWWAETGSHFVVDVPRFEQEILRNNSVPEVDGFKTITFTSFVRQLNLYGFRKVTVNNDKHIDPREWQRYAHTYFICGRPDLLTQVHRQPGPVHSRRATLQSPYVVNAIAAYEGAIEQSFLERGIRPSRKGPRPKFQQSKQKAPKRRKYYLARPSVMPFNIVGYSPMQAYFATPYHQQLQQQQPVNDSTTWNAMSIEVPHQQPNPQFSMTEEVSRPPISTENNIKFQPKQHQVDQWPKDFCLGGRSQFDSSNDSSCSKTVGLNGDPNLMISGEPAFRLEISPTEANERNLEHQMEQFSCSKELQEQCSSTAMAASQFASALNAAVLDDDNVDVTSSETYCMVGDVGNLAMWGDDPNLHGTSILPDQMFVY